MIEGVRDEIERRGLARELVTRSLRHDHCQRVEPQRVNVLEELWYILLGQKLTRIALVAEAYGRTYDEKEEHDAYYLASASLLPKAAMIDAVSKNRSSDQIARVFGTSSELVDYRIKRLGLWREHVGKQIRLSRD